MQLATFTAASSRALFMVVLGLSSWPWAAHAQDRIYRCGNEYTNSPSQAQMKGCVSLQEGNVTVVQGPRQAVKQASTGVQSAGAAGASVGGASPKNQVDVSQQKSRDSDARTILTNELNRAQAQLTDLQRDYNGGKPALKPDESISSASHAQRVTDLKASLARAESDVAGIRRELQRFGGAPTTATVTASNAPAGAAGSGAPANGVVAR